MPSKIDLHVHTCYSGDSLVSLENLLIQARIRGLNGVAITDHDTTIGAIKALKVVRSHLKHAELIIVPGIEVSTREGHILGLNVTVPIPRGLSVEETVEIIHDAGGIAIAAHPAMAASFRKSISLNSKILSYGLDAIESINSSSFPFWLSTYKCMKFARQHNLPQTAGSDAHIPEAIGLSYTLIKDCDVDARIDDLIESIKRGLTKPIGKGMPVDLRIRYTLKKYFSLAF